MKGNAARPVTTIALMALLGAALLLAVGVTAATLTPVRI